METSLVPASGLAALARAGAEALTNVAKHAGVPHATLLVRHDRGGAQVFVADEGVGAGGATDGFGVSARSGSGWSPSAARP